MKTITADRRLRRIAVSCITAVLVCLLQSCFLKPSDRTVNLEAAPDISYGTEWAVITEPYASFRTAPSFGAETTAHGRRGDVMEVKGKQIVPGNKKQTIWYQFEGGWLTDTSVSIYSNRLKAVTASLSL